MGTHPDPPESLPQLVFRTGAGGVPVRSGWPPSGRQGAALAQERAGVRDRLGSGVEHPDLVVGAVASQVFMFLAKLESDRELWVIVLFDLRWVLLALVVALNIRCVMRFRDHRSSPWRRMPILVSFLGVAFFIWGAENIATVAGAWIYPNQAEGWELVPLSKLVARFLLMNISVVLVPFVYRTGPLPERAEAVHGPGHEPSR
jgi:hypothetical protein